MTLTVTAILRSNLEVASQCYNSLFPSNNVLTGDDSPMEITSAKSYLGPSPFVRGGFGRISTTSSKASGNSEHDNNGVDMGKCVLN